MTGIIAKARHYVSLKSLTMIYNTMIYPYLIHCNITWTSTYPTRLQPIYLVQKKIVRIMTFAKFTEKSKPIFQSLKLMNIYELNTYLTALFMFSFLNNKLPDDYFTNNECLHNYNTRSASNIHIIKEQIMENSLINTEEHNYGIDVMFPRHLFIALGKAQGPLNKEVWTFCSFTSCERTAGLKLSQTAWLTLTFVRFSQFSGRWYLFSLS